MQPSPSPRIPANDIRPARRWLFIAPAIAVVLLVLAVVVTMYRFDRAVDAVDTGKEFAGGASVTLRLDPESEKAIWIKYLGGRLPAHECGITGPGDPRLTDAGWDFFLGRDATWNPLYTIEVSQVGDYEVTCSSQEPFVYGIGGPGGFVAFVGGLILTVLLAALGVIACAAVVLVTAVRRRNHRKRLLAEGQVTEQTTSLA